MTTLVGAGEYPARELTLACHERREIELASDERETHQAPALPGKEARLRGETPAGVAQGLHAPPLGHHLTRAFMAEAAAVEGLDPDRPSFVGCPRVPRARLPGLAALREGERAAWYRAFLKGIAAERTGPRRDRVNPRVVKVKMSKLKKKRAEHRNVRPLTQTFEQSILLLQRTVLGLEE